MLISVLQYYIHIFHVKCFAPVPNSSEIDTASYFQLPTVFHANCLICDYSDVKQEKDTGPISLMAD